MPAERPNPMVADADVHRFFELSPDLLCVLEADTGRIAAVNGAWEQALGYRPEQLVGRDAADLVHPDDRPTPRLEEAHRRREAPPARHSNRWRAADGGYRTLLWSASAHDGRWYCVAQDVTAATPAGERRGLEAEWFERIAASIAEGLYVTDGSGRVGYANPSAERILGYGAGELVGCEAHATFHHSFRDGTPFPAAECHLLAVRETGTPYETKDDCFWRKDGTPVEVACSSSPLPLPEGTGSVVVFQDVGAERAAARSRREAFRRVRRSEALHRTLSRNLPGTSVFLIDHDLRVVLAEGEALRGAPSTGESALRGRLLTEVSAVPPDVLDTAIGHYRAALAGERRAFEVELEGVTLAIQAVPIRDDDDGPVEDGPVLHCLVVARDVTVERAAGRAQQRRARQQQAIAEFGRFALETREAAAVIDRAVRTATETLGVEFGGFLELDGAATVLTVRSIAGEWSADVLGARFPLAESGMAGAAVTASEPVIVRDHACEHRFARTGRVDERGIRSSLSAGVRAQGRAYGVLNLHARHAGAFDEDDGAFASALATLLAVALERDQDERAARHAALHDPLTGLPNRTLALDRLEHALARRRRDGIDVAVLALDLDRFKVVNDSLGHGAGDEVLRALAPRLAAVVRPTDTVARLGGDEFAVICPEVDGAHGAVEVAERLAAAVNGPLPTPSGEHFFTVSTGITVAADAGDSAESLLRDADTALYRAKDRGRGRYEVFDEELRRQVMGRVKIEGELRRALERDELEVWYQPVIELGTDRLISTEALVRWRHPERGIVSPLEFIPVAEDTGLIAELGLLVLEHACRQTAQWQQETGTSLGVSVNVSGRQAVNPLFPAEVAAVAARSGILPGTLALEITESVLMEEADSPVTALQRLREHDLTLALDDFGTGYSSLERIKRFPLDVLKVDRSFVAGVAASAGDRTLVKAMVDMAHALGLAVVAEGVETAGQEEALRQLRCDRVQGFLYAEPQPPEAFERLLAGISAWRTRPLR